jgi:hypothetical protein
VRDPNNPVPASNLDIATSRAQAIRPQRRDRNKGFRVNRIKMIKRQMCGRADFSLLRKRVLLAT